MKRSNFFFESVLMAVTIILGLLSLVSRDIVLLGALWLIVLGVLQVVHSLIIGVSNWSVEKIRRPITVYWIGVVFDFIMMFIGKTSLSSKTELITILILPLILATYLWFITYANRITVNPQGT